MYVYFKIFIEIIIHYNVILHVLVFILFGIGVLKLRDLNITLLF